MHQSLGTSLPAKADAVVIGSSPLMLLKALELARTGRQVVVCERENRIGGAWYSRPMLGFESVEAGVHLIENRSVVYRHLEDVGIQLGNAEGDSFGILGSFQIPLSTARTISFLGVTAKSLAGANLQTLNTTLPRMIRSIGSIGTGFRYPSEGARGMIETLRVKLAEHRVNLCLDCKVEEAVLDPDAPRGMCRTSRTMVHFEALYFASRAHCPMRIGEDQLGFRVEPREVISIVLVLPSHRVARFSYVEIISDRVLRRVRDVTAFAVPRVSDDVRILCVQIRESYADRSLTREEIASASLDRLARYGLVENGTTMVGMEIERFSYQTITDGELARVTSQHKSLMGVKTTDFAEDMVDAMRSRDVEPISVASSTP